MNDTGPEGETPMDVVAPRKRRKGIYLLPNLFTTVTLFGGFYAVIAAMNGRYDNAAIAVFAAMAADALDGRIARLTNTQSDFGKEYDSLCDAVAFGLAASLVMYAYSLHYLSEYRWLGGKLGWVSAFAYSACAALRLARFNVHAALAGGKGNFFGLPSPAAAAVMVSFVWSMHDWGFSGRGLVIPATIITLGTGALMVSTVRYHSFKQIKLTERRGFIVMPVLIALLALISMDPPRVLFLSFAGYALSGPYLALRRRLRREGLAVP